MWKLCVNIPRLVSLIETIQASTPAQFACMQAVSFKKLQDTVISTNIPFNLVIDSI
jgi:hypothetical protein